ncbi:MAG: PKD domain-containing protein [Verrucomicrobiota bacterium]
MAAPSAPTSAWRCGRFWSRSTPQDQVSFLGATTTFSIAAQAGSPLSYQWQFNGAILLEPTTSTLALTNILYEQAGVYSVIASTANAVVTNVATLSVVPVAAWGSGSYGKTNIPPDLTNVIAIAAGQIHSLALKNDGTVVAWRYDSIRTNVPSDLTNAVAISAGDSGSLALRADGTIAAWGYNNRGQTNIPPELTNVIAVAAGGYHNLALKANGTVVAWGQNNSGQTNVPVGLTNVVAVNAHDEISLAVTANGRVIAWGYNGTGQTNVPSDLSNVVAVVAGTVHCVALKSDGTLAVWGSTTSYGLGNIPAEATNIVAVGAGYGHCLVLRDDGTLVAWGYPYDGRTTIPSGLQHVTTIAAGSDHNLALIGGTPFSAPVLAANPTWSNNSVNITVPTRSGRVYRLEYKDSFSDNSWIALPLVAGTGGTLTLTDSAATGTQRFYRVRRW